MSSRCEKTADTGAQAPEAGDCIRSLRRSPRIPFGGTVEVLARRETRRALMQDIGVGGCLLVPNEELVRGTCVTVVLPGSTVAGPVTVQGRVVWARGNQAGVEFTERSAAVAESWVRRLVTAQPTLVAVASRAPVQLDLTTALYALPRPRSATLTDDELAVHRVAQRMSDVGTLIRRSGLPAHQAERAIFGLLEKRLLTLSANEAVREPTPSSPREAREPVERPSLVASLDDLMRALRSKDPARDRATDGTTADAPTQAGEPSDAEDGRHVSSGSVLVGDRLVVPRLSFVPA